MTELTEDDFVEVWAEPQDAQATAAALLEAAEEEGERVEVVESLGGGGFRVPRSVADAAKLPRGADVEKPVDDMTTVELKAYAAKHDIDLGDATKKADILATVKAASPTE